MSTVQIRSVCFVLVQFCCFIEVDNEDVFFHWYPDKETTKSLISAFARSQHSLLIATAGTCVLRWPFGDRTVFVQQLKKAVRRMTVVPGRVRPSIFFSNNQTLAATLEAVPST